MLYLHCILYSSLQVGAPAAALWQLRTRRVGPGWEDEQPYLVNISGTANEATLSLALVNNVKGWSPDCDNTSNTNKFDFAVQVMVVEPETGTEFVGPWSEAVTVAAYCSPALSWTIIIVVCVVVAIAVVVVVLLVCRASHWWLLKKDFFDKLGKELDAKFVLASVDNLDGGGGGGGGGPDYELRQFDIRTGGGEDGKEEDPGDTDTLLLRGASSSSSPGQLPPPHHRQKSSASESAQSDFTTSGFGGSSQGCTSAATTATLSDDSSARHLPSEAGSSSAVSGYISMMGGRADSGQSNYTQLALARPRTLSGPATSALHHPTSRPASYCAATSSSDSRPSSLPPVPGGETPIVDPLAATTPGDSLPQQQLSLSDWNSFPGYSLVTSTPGGLPAPAAAERRPTNGYVPALPPSLVVAPSLANTQVTMTRPFLSVMKLMWKAENFVGFFVKKRLPVSSGL